MGYLILSQSLIVNSEVVNKACVWAVLQSALRQENISVGARNVVVQSVFTALAEVMVVVHDQMSVSVHTK